MRKDRINLPLVFILLGALLIQVVKAADRPNFIFFLGDDHDILDYGCYGNPVVITPAIDRLATEGMRFTKTFTGQAICAPSRSQLYTGLYPLRNGCFQNHIETSEQVMSVTDYFKTAGYDVILAGKSHVKPVSVYDWTYFWEETAPVGDMPHGNIPIDQIKNYLSSTAKPFCMFVASNYPHGPFIDGDIYTEEDIVVYPFFERLGETRSKYVGHYHNIIEEDKQVGALLEVLDSLPAVSANTVMVYASDHGTSGKYTTYDAGLNVPMIVRWPGTVEPGTVSDALVHFTDVLPTFMESAGVSIPGDIDGKSFLPVLKGETNKHHEYVYGVETHQNLIGACIFPSRSVRSDSFHYICNFNSIEVYEENLGDDPNINIFIKEGAEKYAHLPYEELYYVTEDSFEMINLAGDPSYAVIKDELRDRMLGWMHAQGDFLLYKKMPLLPDPNNALDDDPSSPNYNILKDSEVFDFNGSYGTTPLAVSLISDTGLIECEDFVSKSGMDTIPTSDAGGGKELTNIKDGDYADYQIFVSRSGYYDVRFRVASEKGRATISLAIGSDVMNSGSDVMNSGSIALGSVAVRSTGGDQNWTDITGNVHLPEGPNTLRCIFTGDSADLLHINRISFSRSEKQDYVHLFPGDDIQTKVNANPAGTSFILNPGVYRTQSVTPKTGNSFTGMDGAIMNGSRILTNWQQEGNLWVHGGQTQQGSQNAGDACMDGYPRCHFPEDIFIDGNLLIHRESKDKVLTTNDWYFDQVADKVYIMTHPAGHTIEIGVNPEAFKNGASNVTIKNIIVEKYASPTQYGAIGGTGGDNWTVEDCEMRWNHGTALHFTGASIIRNNYVHHNGQLGIKTRENSTGAFIEGNEVAFNKVSPYITSWEAGGSKFARTNKIKLTGNYFHDNFGNGFWSDIDNMNLLFENNLSENNDGQGIFHEISQSCIIRCNLSRYNGEIGIYLSHSSDGEVYNNTVFVKNGDGIIIKCTSRSDVEDQYAENNRLHHNEVFFESTAGQNGLIVKPTCLGSGGNISDSNIYHVQNLSDQHFFWENNTANTLDWVQTNASQEAGSTIDTSFPDPVKYEGCPVLDVRPVVNFTNIKDIDRFMRGSVVPVYVQAFDPEGGVESVELFLDGFPVGYKKKTSYDWELDLDAMDVQPGMHVLKAVGTDISGKTDRAISLIFIGEDLQASLPDPADGESIAEESPVLFWKPGYLSESSDVYFGSSPETLKNADHGSPEYKGNQPEASYSPGVLNQGATYYWRIDAVHADSLVKGSVWSFSIARDLINTADFTLLEIATGEPVYRATFTHDDGVDLSSRDGKITIEKPYSYTIHYKLEHTDYFTVEDSVPVTADTSLYIFLTPKLADIIFEISDLTGPLSGAKVILNSYATFTGTNGRTLYLNKPARKMYGYRIESEGFSPYADSVYLETDTTIMINLATVHVPSNAAGYLRIYPNPACQELNIESDYPAARLHITSMQGKTLLENKLVQGLNRFDISTIEEGMYLIRIQSDKNSILCLPLFISGDQ